MNDVPLSGEQDIADYLKSIEDFPTLSMEQLRTELRAYRLGAEAEKRLVECYLRLIPKIAQQYAGTGVPLLELLQEGNVGLMYSVRQFAGEPEEFESFAIDSIRKNISRAVQERKTSQSQIST